jgi:hypothetical protein
MTSKDKQAKDREQQRKNASELARNVLDPVALAGEILAPFYTNNLGDDGNDETIQRDAAKAFHEATSAAVEKLRSGDLAEVERMLASSAVVLQTLMAGNVQRAQKSGNLVQIDICSRIALKAADQLRKTLATLVEVKNPRRAVFIKKQQNLVHVQQSEKSENFSQKQANELLTEGSYGNPLDTGTQGTSSRVDPHLETVEAKYWPSN